MFNALNRFMSRLDGDSAHQLRQEPGTYGFQVLRNTNIDLNIEPWFDFIVGINGRPLDTTDAALFAQEVRNCAGGSVSLGLWSAKGRETREMHVPVPADTASLGLSLQCAPLSLATNIWHVTDVLPNSPADQATLLPEHDWILGSPEGALNGERALSELVEDFIGRPLRLFVYNGEFDVTREVTITPSRGWGGQGVMGCTLGYGAIHVLPSALSEPPHAPGETMFDSGVNEKSDAGLEPAAGEEPSSAGGAEYLVPAQLAAPTTAPPRSSKKKERAHHGKTPDMMDDYFKEEEAKSREVDNAPSSKAGNVAPPPKAGGPPRASPAPSAPETPDAEA